MSKTIKVDDDVYEALDGIRIHRETFSGVVRRLIKLHTAIEKAADILGPGRYLVGSPGFRDKVMEEAIGARRDLDARTLKKEPGG